MDDVNKNEQKKDSNSENFYTQSEEQKKFIQDAKKIESKNSPYYHGSASCCSKDTKVLTTYGEKSISNIKVGDFVLTENNKFEKVIMINKVPVLNHMVLQLTFSDKTILKVSPNHPTADMRLVKDLKAGDLLTKEIIEIKLIPYNYKYTYDILPDSLTGTYYANGILIGSTLSTKSSIETVSDLSLRATG